MRFETKPPPPPSPAPCVECKTVTAGTNCPKCGALVHAGRYTVIDILNKTDHGGVYMVREPGGLELILQEIRVREAPTDRAMQAWAHEAEVLPKLDHPLLPQFLELFTEGSGAGMRFYRVQQLVVGEHVALQVKRFPFQEGRVRDIGRQLLELLDLLHGPGARLVHGDVKASNIVLDNDGKLWLVGWGRTFLLPESSQYTPGKTAEPGHINHPSADVYGVGWSLLHLLARRDPAEFRKPGDTTPIETQVTASPQMSALLERLIGEPAHARISDARVAFRQIRSVQLKQRQRGVPLWMVFMIVSVLLGILTGLAYWRMAIAR